MSDEIAHLPAWVRRRDGSQVPFEPDRICQSLYLSAESLGMGSAFLIRELTDAVLHFLSQNPFDGIPSSAEIAVEVEKIVREVGHPLLAQRYAEMQRTPSNPTSPPTSSTASLDHDTPARYIHECLAEYAARTIFSRDVTAAAREGLLRLGGLEAPASLASLVLETPRFAELPWWLALEDWRTSGGGRWIVESPEWLCTPQMHPALTPHLCERLLSLPTLAQREVELHLNIAEPPAWSPGRMMSPLFSASDEDGAQHERSNFLDGLLERWRSLQTPRMPSVVWHVNGRSFRDDTERRQLHALVRLATQGRAIRFAFDRPGTPISLAGGLDRRCPGSLLSVELELASLAAQPDVGQDGATLLKKLPSLARIAVSAAHQKREYLRRLPLTSPLKRRFLIERAAGSIVPNGLDEAVRAITGASLLQSPLSLDFALKVVATLKDTLQKAGRSINLDLRLDIPADARIAPALAEPPAGLQKEIIQAGKLHACAGAGVAALFVQETKPEDLVELLSFALHSTAVVGLQYLPAAARVQQGEFPTETDA